MKRLKKSLKSCALNADHSWFVVMYRYSITTPPAFVRMVQRRFGGGAKRDPYPVLRQECVEAGISEKELDQWEKAQAFVEAQYKDAEHTRPQPEDLFNHQFALLNHRRKRRTRTKKRRTHCDGGCGPLCHQRAHG